MATKYGIQENVPGEIVEQIEKLYADTDSPARVRSLSQIVKFSMVLNWWSLTLSISPYCALKGEMIFLSIPWNNHRPPLVLGPSHESLRGR